MAAKKTKSKSQKKAFVLPDEELDKVLSDEELDNVTGGANTARAQVIRGVAIRGIVARGIAGGGTVMEPYGDPGGSPTPVRVNRGSIGGQGGGQAI